MTNEELYQELREIQGRLCEITGIRIKSPLDELIHRIDVENAELQIFYKTHKSMHKDETWNENSLWKIKVYEDEGFLEAFGKTFQEAISNMLGRLS